MKFFANHMRLAARLFAVWLLNVLLIGCASPPKNETEAIESLHKLLFDVDTPFQRRLAQLGLRSAINVDEIKGNESFRLEVTKGYPIRWARLVISETTQPSSSAYMELIFDPLVMCIAESDMKNLGMWQPRMPIHVSENRDGRIINLAPRWTPQVIRITSDGVTINLVLDKFENDCLTEVAFNIKLRKS